VVSIRGACLPPAGWLGAGNRLSLPRGRSVLTLPAMTMRRRCSTTVFLLGLGLGSFGLGEAEAVAQSLWVLPPEPPGLPPPPAVLPPPRADARWQLDATLSGDVYSIHPSQAPTSDSDASGKRAAGSLELTRFLTPVVDDDAPRSLQPFLQRAGALSVSIGGSGFDTQYPFNALSAQNDRTDAHFGTSLGLDVYVTRVFALTAGLGYGYDVLHDPSLFTPQTSHSFSAGAGFGLRGGDTRFDLAYAFSATSVNGTFAPLRWGTLEGTLYTVFDRRFSLGLWGLGLQSGGGGGLDLGFYTTKDFGVFLGGLGEHGELYQDSLVLNRYSGYAGASYWVVPQVRLSGYYTFTANDVPGQVGPDVMTSGSLELDHQIQLRASFRLP
jgi:hypothetical protein